MTKMGIKYKGRKEYIKEIVWMAALLMMSNSLCKRIYGILELGWLDM